MAELTERFARRIKRNTDPALDQMFAYVRDILNEIGIGELTRDEARIALAIHGVLTNLPKDLRVAAYGYLATRVATGSGHGPQEGEAP